MPLLVTCTRERRMAYWKRWARRNRRQISITGAWRGRTWRCRTWTNFTDLWPPRRTTTVWSLWPPSKPSTIPFGACNSIRRKTSTNGAPIWLRCRTRRVQSRPACISPISSSVKVIITVLFFLHIQLIINVINCVFHQQLVRVNIGFLRDVKRRVTWFTTTHQSTQATSPVASSSRTFSIKTSCYTLVRRSNRLTGWTVIQFLYD